jgi:hypothetical protein
MFRPIDRSSSGGMSQLLILKTRTHIVHLYKSTVRRIAFHASVLYRDTGWVM